MWTCFEFPQVSYPRIYCGFPPFLLIVPSGGLRLQPPPSKNPNASTSTAQVLIVFGDWMPTFLIAYPLPGFPPHLAAPTSPSRRSTMLPVIFEGFSITMFSTISLRPSRSAVQAGFGMTNARFCIVSSGIPGCADRAVALYPPCAGLSLTLYFSVVSASPAAASQHDITRC